MDEAGPTSLDELERARQSGAYEPVFDQRLNEHRWTIDSWSCPRCWAGGCAPFNARGYLRHQAYGHMRQHEWMDEQRIRRADELEYHNSQPNRRAWIDPDGRLRIRYVPSPREPGRLAHLIQRWRDR